MTSSLFVDSWGWLVLANEREPSFESAKSIYQKELREGHRILTTDYVMDEVITFLFAKAPAMLAARYIKQFFASMEAGFIRMERISPDRFEKAWKMRLKYKDHSDISFTDFTSFVVMQEISVRRVLTNDRHFEQVNLGLERLPTIPA